jgi:SAM-dependent methyltransferase
VEIGPGTGQATLPLAERGFEIVGVELGERLTAFAREKLSAFNRVEIVNAPFETWEPDGQFDAVVAFTAFHWIDPEARYEGSARLLRPGGALAIVKTKHVAGSDPFWAEVRADYEAVVPSEENKPPPLPEEVEDLAAEIATSRRFGPAVIRRYLWDVQYDADSYINVLETYSGHRSIPEDRRKDLYERIRRRIGDSEVSKTMLAILHVARA